MLVATDQSDTATRAMQWAAEMSGKYAAELLVLQVVAPEHLTAREGAADDLAAFTRQVCGERGRPLLVYDSDPAEAIVRVCEQERVNLVVVGNVGMRDRTEFLLGSVPNQVSHNARCSVVIVNTALNGASTTPRQTARAAAEPSESQLLGRAAHVARIFARYGLRDVMHGGKNDEAERARRFRSALEELGPTFAKLGQILSTLPDLLPAAVVAELADLQDHVAPLTEAEVVAVMEAELKVPRRRPAWPGASRDTAAGGARRRGAPRGRPPAGRGLLPAGPDGRVLPRRPPSGEPASSGIPPRRSSARSCPWRRDV